MVNYYHLALKNLPEIISDLPTALNSHKPACKCYIKLKFKRLENSNLRLWPVKLYYITFFPRKSVLASLTFILNPSDFQITRYALINMFCTLLPIKQIFMHPSLGYSFVTTWIINRCYHTFSN